MKISLDYPEDAWKELDSIIWEYRPEALQYFPDGIIYGALSGSFSCPQAKGDEFNVWILKYKDLLKSKGIEEHDYTMPSNQSPFANG